MRFHIPNFFRFLVCATATWGLGTILPSDAFADPDPLVQVYFTTDSQSVNEYEDFAEITIRLSRPSNLTVEVPFSIDGASTATNGTDFDIFEGTDEVEGTESPIVFEPGEIAKSIIILIENDNTEEGDETIVVTMNTGSVTVAQPVDFTQHTITIVDNDPVMVDFEEQAGSFDEFENIVVPVVLSTPVAEDVNVPFELSLGTATSDDTDAGAETSTQSPLVIPAGETSGVIVITVVNDDLVDDLAEETVMITMQTPTLENGGDLTGATEPYVATIVDNDPVQVNFVLDVDGDGEDDDLSVDEFEVLNIGVELSSPTGNDVTVPFTVTIDGEEVTDSDARYAITESPLTITSPETMGTITISVEQDDAITEDVTVVVTMGTPEIPDVEGAVIEQGDANMVTTMIHNVDPISIFFGMLDEDTGEYVPFPDRMVMESAGQLRVTLALTSQTLADVTLDLSVGGTATMFDPDTPVDEQDWDFAVTSATVDVDPSDTTDDITILSGARIFSFLLTINDDEEPPVVYGEDPPADVEDNETIVFTISNVDTDEGMVSPGEATTHTITIVDNPDIDVTALFEELEPDPEFLDGDGNVRLNDQTGLNEVKYVFNLMQALTPVDYSGYRSFKIRSRIAQFDDNNPDSADNDPITTSPENPSTGEVYTKIITPPFMLRYANGADQFVRIEGTPQPDGVLFEEANADTLELARYVLHPLNLPPIDPNDTDTREEYHGLNEPFSMVLEFLNSGHVDFPVEKLHPAEGESIFEIFISDTDIASPELTSSGPIAGIYRFEPQEDGSMLFEVDTTPQGSYQMQYMDESGEWKAAQPGTVTIQSSRWYWIDYGPPKTEAAPDEVSTRLYRVVQ